MMKSIQLRARQRFRTSALTTPYWTRRRDRILANKGYYAQNGEDRAILELVGDRGSYLDIGGNHPFLSSNTYLLYQRGWRGVTVEPIRSLWRMHRRWRPEDIALNVGVGTGDRFHFYELYPDAISTSDPAVAETIQRRGDAVLIAHYDVPLVTGAEIVRTHFANRELTLLSIDVEGAELDVLRSFDFASGPRPRFVLFEHGNFIPNQEVADGSRQILSDLGYRFEREIGCNSLYARSDTRR